MEAPVALGISERWCLEHCIWGGGREAVPAHSGSHKGKGTKLNFLKFLLAFIDCRGGFVVTILNSLTLYIG
jgi:hypothetical protein